MNEENVLVTRPDLAPYGLRRLAKRRGVTPEQVLVDAIASHPTFVDQDPGAAAKTAVRFAEGKLSPAVSIANNLRKGSTYLGEPLDPTSGPGGAWQTFLDLGKESLPFGIQSAIDEGPLSVLASGTGFTSTPMTPSEQVAAERGDTSKRGALSLTPGALGLPENTGIAQAQFGQPYQDLTGAKKSLVNESPAVKSAQAAVDRNALSGDTEKSAYAGVALDSQTKLEALSQELESGQITGNEFRDQYQRMMDQLRGAKSVTDHARGNEDVAGWFDLYNEAALPDGRTDYTKLERLQQDYAAAHPGVEAKVDALTGTRDNQTLRDYRQARGLARVYHDIPSYLGLSAEESQHASKFLAAAQDMVSYGQAPDSKTAMLILGQRDPEGMVYAEMARLLGPNFERELYRKDPKNALFAKFYSDAPAGDVSG